MLLFPSKHDGEVKGKSGRQTAGGTGPRNCAGNSSSSSSGFSFFWAALERQRSFDPIHDPFCLLLCFTTSIGIDQKKIVVRDPAVKVTRWASGEPNNNNNNTLGIYNKIGGRESLFVAHFNGVCVVCVCTLNDTQFKLNYGAPMKSRSVRKHWTLWQHTHSNTQTKPNTLFSKE